MEKIKKEICGNPDCKSMAQWCYLPGYSSGCSPYSCDDCVPRGCSCGLNRVDENRLYSDGKDESDYLPEGVEDIDWKWVVEIDGIETEIPEKLYWVYLDNGREYPCGGEYTYEENGFYTEEYEKFLEAECQRIGYDILSDEIVVEQYCFKEKGEYYWPDELIEKIEKIIEEYNNNNLK